MSAFNTGTILIGALIFAVGGFCGSVCKTASAPDRTAFEREAVITGHAEYYHDAFLEKQWRWKAPLKEVTTLREPCQRLHFENWQQNPAIIWTTNTVWVTNTGYFSNGTIPTLWLTNVDTFSWR